MMEDILARIVADILDLPEADISDGLGPDLAESWDSMNHLRMVTAIEQEFGISLSMEEIQSIASVGDFRQAIARRSG